MKHKRSKLIIAVFLVIFILGLLPITAYAAEPADIVVGSSYTLKSGESINDGLAIFGGNVNLMPGSTVNGDVVIFGGSLDAAGTITGNLVVIGGSVSLANTLVVNGNFTNIGGSVSRDPGAQINGQTITGRNFPQIFTIPGMIRINEFGGNGSILLRVAGFFLGLFIWVLLAMLVAMFLPNQLNRTSRTVLTEPVASGGIGCLTVIIVPIVIVLLAITICLIPVALLVALLLVIAWAFGLIALGIEVGKRIGHMFNQVWHPAVAAGIGTLLLMFVLNAVDAVIPCVGWLPKALVGLFGLGAVLLTQFGTKDYPTSTPLPPQYRGEPLPPYPPTSDLAPQVPPESPYIEPDQPPEDILPPEPPVVSPASEPPLPDENQ